MMKTQNISGRGGGGSLYKYIIEEEESASPCEILIDYEKLEILGESFYNLNELQKKVLISRYGLDGESPKTLNEIALTIGLTKERVRQIEVKAISILKKSLEY